MDRKRLRILIFSFFFIFLISDAVAASYIFSNTVRANDPDWVFETDSDILYSSLSGAGEALIYGSGNSIYFHYIMNPTPSRMYTLDSGVKQVIVANDIKAMIALDMENNLYFLRFGGGPELLTLYYKIPFDENIDLGGIIVLGKSAQTTRILAYSEHSIYIFSSHSDQPLLKHDFTESVTCVEISHYGDLILVGTDSGETYLFRTFEESLEWQYTCDSSVSSVAISPFAQFGLIGTKSGSVYLFNLDDKLLLWKKSLDIAVKKVFIRSSGSESLIWGANGDSFLYDRDGALIKSIEDVDNLYLSYWGNYVSYSKDGKFYMLREMRGSADWEYAVDEDIRSIGSNYGSTLMMLTFKDKILIFYEDPLMIMGSRQYWSLLSLVVLLQVAILGYIMYLQKSMIYDIIHNREFMEFFVGAIAGLIGAVILAGGVTGLDSINVIIGMMASGLASWQCSRLGGGLVGAFSGYITGLFGSLAIGAAFGIYYWLGGAEENIISSFFGTAFYGGLVGTFFSIIGLVIGLIIKDYFEEYRRKKSIKA